MKQRASRERRSAPTIRDVARHAGVSHMTVSRVINREASVRPETRKLVQSAIDTLNFAPSPVARALAGAEHLRIALLHRFPSPGHLGEYLVSLLGHTSRVHASVLVHKVSGSGEDEAVVRELADHSINAAILAPPLADDHHLVELLEAAGVAMVATGSSRVDARLASVGIDDQGAARAMTDHLLALGHRRIGFIKGDPHHASTEFRLTGYRSALEAGGLAFDPALVADGRYTYQSGLEAAEKLLALEVPPTAIFASNDDMAAATVAVAHRSGIDVPADLSVCGFDDTALATTIWPALTTIRQPTVDITRIAVDTLIRELSAKGDAPAEPRVVLPHQIVRRHSDAPPRRRPRLSDHQA